MSETETVKVIEPTKTPSKLDKVKSAAATTACFVVPTVAVVGLVYASYRMVDMQLETAQLNLEAAKLTKS